MADIFFILYLCVAAVAAVVTFLVRRWRFKCIAPLCLEDEIDVAITSGLLWLPLLVVEILMRPMKTLGDLLDQLIESMID